MNTYLPRAPSHFPFEADFVSVQNGSKLRQRVTVLARFGNKYRVEATSPLIVPGLNNPVPAHVSHAIPISAIREKRH